MVSVVGQEPFRQLQGVFDKTLVRKAGREKAAGMALVGKVK